MGHLFIALSFLLVATVAKADSYPAPHQMGQVKNLAQQFETDARQLHSEASRFADLRDALEREALENLRILTREADEFNRNVAINYSFPARTSRAFESLDR